MFYIILYAVFITSVRGKYNVGVLYSSLDSYSDPAIYKRFDEYVLGRKSNTSISLVHAAYEADLGKRYQAICDLISQDVVAIITMSQSTLTAQEADQLNLLNIPLVAVSATNPFIKTANRPLLIRMAPPDIYQGVAIFELLRYYHWNDFCILASSDDYGINGMIGLLGKASSNRDMKLVCIEYFDPDSTQIEIDLRQSLRNVKNSLSRVIILNCGIDFADMIFEIAYDYGLLMEGFIWITTDSISTQFEARDKRFDGVLGTVPVKEETDKVQSFMSAYYDAIESGKARDFFAWTLLFIDSLKLLDEAFKNSPNISLPSSYNTTCNSMKPWPEGSTIYERVINTSVVGLTGAVSFDEGGLTKSNAYRIKNIRERIFHPVGWWNIADKVHIDKAEKVQFLGGLKKVPSGEIESLSGRKLKLGTIYEPPYSIRIKTDFCKSRYWDPNCWTGFDFDLLFRLAEDLNFTYEISEPSDNQYGVYDKELKRFTGLIYELQSRKIDMISTPLIINYERSSAVEFLSDVMIAKSVSIFIGSSHQFENPLFFLAPLDPMLWVVMILLIIVLGIIVSLLSRMSPYLSHQNGKNSPQRPISFYHGVFLIACGIVGSKGWNGIPNSPAVRFVLIAWWFFTTIVISMYTANLTAFITFEHVSSEIHSLEDLLMQNKYTWGTIEGSAEIDMLLNRRQSDFSLIAQNAINTKDIFEAQQKVRKGEYVFIYDDLTIGHTFKQFCNASMFNNELPSSGLSFAVAKNSPLQKVLSSYILKYKEEGYIGELKNKWFQDNYNYCTEHMHANRKSFKIKVLAGLFYMAGIGVLLAFVIAAVEYIKIAYSKWRTSPDEKNFLKVLYSVCKSSSGSEKELLSDSTTACNEETGFINSGDIDNDTIIDTLQRLIDHEKKRITAEQVNKNCNCNVNYNNDKVQSIF